MKKIFWLIIALVIFYLLLGYSVPRKQSLSYGATFSQKFSEELVGNDWRKNYLALLDDLKIKDLRLVAYWDKIEPAENVFDFNDLNWQIAEAEKRGAKIILVVGRKAPRWPECHEPRWVKGDEAKYLLRYIEVVVNQYKNHPAIRAWQIENEPLFPFGECGPPAGGNFKLLSKEIKLVKSLSDKPIILTDSGELGFAWPYLAVKSDIFGTTLYRYVSHRWFGEIRYSLIPASYFRLKAGWAKLWGKDYLISELQAEPWAEKSLKNVPLEWQNKKMNPEIFNKIIDYAERSGFPRAHLWGAEWWYFMKEKQGRPEMWEAVKALSANSHE